MTSDKVVPLSIVSNKDKPPKFKPLDEETIASLAHALEAGKAGKLLAIAFTYAEVEEDGTVTRTTGTRYTNGQIVYLCGLVAILHKRVQLLEDKT